MKFIIKGMRRFTRWRFQARGLSTIQEIPDDTFLGIVSALEAQGWKVVSRYAGIDAGIDYDCIRIRRDGIKLKCEWDRWDEWSIEGPTPTVQPLADRFGLSTVPRSRWDSPA